MLVRRNVLVMFMCVELMLNAVNLTFVAFAHELNDIRGQVIVFFTLVVAAAEVAVGLGDHRGHLPAPPAARPPTTSSSSRADRARPEPHVNARDLLDLVWIVPALPLFGAVLLLLFGRRIGEPVAGWIATGLMALAFAWSVVMFVRAARPAAPRRGSTSHNLFTGSRRARSQVDIGSYADPLSVTWLLLVTGVGTLIHLYSIGYMHGDPRFSRFFAYLNLFAASMLDPRARASASSSPSSGGRASGLCSYLLVSFWFERNAAAVAGKKAFVTNRVGDVGFLLAMFLIFAVVRHARLRRDGARRRGRSRRGTATAIALLLLLVGAVGKSAQIPLHVWLPDAMEGPTPVSALIHAATMVTAGVFLAVPRVHRSSRRAATRRRSSRGSAASPRCSRARSRSCSPTSSACSRTRPSASSATCSSRVGVGAYSAAVFMVICHAFYKGCLFLGAGSVIHGNHDNQDMRIMGRFRKYLPYTAMAMVVAWLAIAGMPPFSGFFSKDEIIAEAFLARRLRPLGRRRSSPRSSPAST